MFGGRFWGNRFYGGRYWGHAGADDPTLPFRLAQRGMFVAGAAAGQAHVVGIERVGDVDAAEVGVASAAAGEVSG